VDFFEHQEVARRSTKRLVVLFALAVISVVVAVNAVGAFLYFSFALPAENQWTSAALPNGFFLVNTLVVLGLIGGGTAVEMNALSSGGDAVAKMVGARALDPSTRDLLDRRLLNVVEEMAIASGVPVPRVFVMDEEDSINAFAAGHSINDAVIAVTRGTLTRLSRDELQGVVAHEFSHILNGDMRLNMRLIGVLFGLMVVAMAGRFLLEVTRRSRGGGRGSGGAIGVLLLAGASLWALGYIGVFFGRLIKAAVSRQREFLADASAVQFTRNRDGIGGALRKIGGLTAANGLGSRIDHPQAEALSHLFLGAARPSFVRGLFATHPPLAERVRRVYGRAVEMLPAPADQVALSMSGAHPAAATPPARGAFLSMPASGTEAAGSASAGFSASPLTSAAMAATSAAAAGQLTEAVGTVNPLRSAEFALDDAQRATLAVLRDAANDALHSRILVLALLIETDADLRSQQRTVLSESYGPEALPLVDEYHAHVQRLPPGARQPLVDVAMPSLRRLPSEERQRLLHVAHMLILADGRLSVREFLLYTILRRRLGPDAGRAVPARYRTVADVAEQAALVLSLTAALRLPQRAEHAFNAGVLLLPGVEASFTPGDAIRLDEVSDALDHLNQLAPLAKPQFIKAAAATAFTDGTTNWRAASTVRMICAALDAPLPPQLVAVEGA
jgi:Zn-dependent protease with chaperone function